MSTFLDRVGGKFRQLTAIITSAGGADANKLVQTGADGKLDPSLIPGQATQSFPIADGVTIAIGDFVYITAAGRIDLAQADAEGKEAVAHATEAGTGDVGGTVTATVNFEDFNTNVSGLTPGGAVFLSTTTPGGITQTPVVTGSNEVDQKLGTAISSTSMSVEIEECVVMA